MLDIITLGSATMDVFVKTDAKTLKIKTQKDNQQYLALPYGSKILINDISHHSGGGGTNSAVAFSKFGLKTGFIGSIGEDHNGDKILQELKDHKIKFLGKIHDKTGYSVILDAGKDRTILTYKGCNNKIPLEKRIPKAKYYYITSMTGKAFTFSKQLAEYAQKIKAKLFFNPSSYLTEKGLNYIKPILRNTYCLILNSDEAKSLTGNDNVLENLEILSKQIVLDGIVVITQGSKGAYAYQSRISYQIKSKKIEVKETTGAGDAFGSSFVFGLIKNKIIPNCLKMGAINSEHTIQHLGAKEGLLGKSIMTHINADKRNIIIRR